MDSPTTTPISPRHSIDPETFSLVISDAQLSDSDDSYQCVLGVEDPLQSGRTFTYEITESVEQRLIVFSKCLVCTSVNVINWALLLWSLLWSVFKARRLVRVAVVF